MRTIVKWSKSAIILIVVTAILAAGVFVQKVHADAMARVSQSQSEVRETKQNLEAVKSEKTEMAKAVMLKDAKIQELEQENSELKE